ETDRTQDAPAVPDQPHLGGAARMIAHGHRHFTHPIAAAHRLEQQVWLELIAVEPRLVEPDARVVEQRQAEGAETVGPVGRWPAAGDAEQPRVETRQPAALGG